MQMNSEVLAIQVHRFRDAVAVSLSVASRLHAGTDSLPTVYLPPEFATFLADRIKEAVADISAHKFTEGTFRTATKGEV